MFKVVNFNFTEMSSSFIFFLSYNISSIRSTPSCLFLVHSSISLQKKQNLQGIATQHSIIGYSKTRHRPSIQCWVKQPSRREKFPRAGGRVTNISVPTAWRSIKNNKLHNYNVLQKA